MSAAMVDQTIVGEGGNCFAACLASILSLDIAEVPNFCHDFGERWPRHLQEWLLKRGLQMVTLSIRDMGPVMWAMPGECVGIASGPGPRGFRHSVIGRIDREGSVTVLHDPHPSRAGLTALEEFDYFIVANPIGRVGGLR